MGLIELPTWFTSTWQWRGSLTTRLGRELITLTQPSSSAPLTLVSEELPPVLTRAGLGPVSHKGIIHCREKSFLQFGNTLSNQFYTESMKSQIRVSSVPSEEGDTCISSVSVWRGIPPTAHLCSCALPGACSSRAATVPPVIKRKLPEIKARASCETD